MIRAVFFDFDGVLTTHQTGGYTNCIYLHHKTGIDYDTIKKCYDEFNYDLTIGKTTFAQIWDEFCKRVGKQIDIKLLHEAFESTPPNSSVLELANQLKTNYTLGIITNNKVRRIETVTKKLNFNQTFEHIIISARVGATKGEKKIFDEALTQANATPDQCVFIDNQQKNLIVPKQMGFKTIFFDTQNDTKETLADELRKCGVVIQ